MQARRGKAIVRALLLISTVWTVSTIIIGSFGHGLTSSIEKTPPFEPNLDNQLGSIDSASADDIAHDFDMTAASMIDRAIQNIGHYSGMWWMTFECFMSHVRPEGFNTLEDASIHAFRDVGRDHVFMTHDWLDLAVEHLSRFVRSLHFGRDDVMGQVMAKIMRYIEHTPALWPPITAFSQTVAVIPIFVDESAWNNTFLMSVPKSISKASRTERTNLLDKLSLAATLQSLCRVGMKRIVVVGNLPDEPMLIQGAFRLAKTVGCNKTDIVYGCPFPEAQAKVKNMPKVVLQALKEQYNWPSNAEVTWLGKDRDQFKYLYFSEPDLILHTRAKALVRMAARLDQPFCGLWSAHRFQPLPHQIDFPTWPRTMPMDGNFSQFHDLTIDSNDTCNDAGNYWPGRTIEHCGAPWYGCGFDRWQQPPMERLKRLVAYPMIRIQDGLGIPLVDEHARMCIPKRDES